MERKMKGATSLQELPDKYQLKGVFKAAANSRIKYFSVYDKNGMSSWPTVVSNDVHEDEYIFLSLNCNYLDIFLKAHVDEVESWCKI